MSNSAPIRASRARASKKGPWQRHQPETEQNPQSIYLGHFPSYARNMALVLNPKAGLMLTQLYVIFEDDFSTLMRLRAGTVSTN